jgi:hypothetical protein
VIDYIDAHRDRFGVEPICRILRQAGVAIAPSTYWAARTRPPSSRAVRDATVKQQIAAVHAANYGVYGVRKMHAALVRDGVVVGRDPDRAADARTRSGRGAPRPVGAHHGAGHRRRTGGGPGQPTVRGGSAESAVGV